MPGPAPKIEYASDVDAVVRKLEELWPRRRTSPGEANAIVRYYHRHSAQALREALEQFKQENLDAKEPHWKTITQILRSNDRQKYYQRDDAAAYVRSCVASYGKDADPVWGELLEADQSGQATEADLRNWWETRQKLLVVSYRVLSPFSGMTPVPAHVAASLIETSHFMVRNLRTFGYETAGYKQQWLGDLEVAGEQYKANIERQTNAGECPF